MQNTRINKAWNKSIIIDNDALYLPVGGINEVIEQKTRFEITFLYDELNKKDKWVHKVCMTAPMIKEFRKWCKAKGFYIKSEQGNLDN